MVRLWIGTHLCLLWWVSVSLRLLKVLNRIAWLKPLKWEVLAKPCSCWWQVCGKQCSSCWWQVCWSNHEGSSCWWWEHLTEHRHCIKRLPKHSSIGNAQSSSVFFHSFNFIVIFPIHQWNSLSLFRFSVFDTTKKSNPSLLKHRFEITQFAAFLARSEDALIL